MKVVAFVPLKLNNERLPSKNTKRFTNGSPLLTYVLNTISACRGIDERYVYCSNDSVKEYLPYNFSYLTRDVGLDTSETKINEVLVSFMRDVPADVYVLAHATAPFLSRESVEAAVNAVVQGGHDSAFAAQKLQEFLWLDGAPVNFDPKLVPRTQDLPKYYAETTGLYVYKRQVLEDFGCRVGASPFVVEVSKIEAVDINEAIDFEFADAIFDRFYRAKA